MRNKKIVLGAVAILTVVLMTQKKAIADAMTENSDEFTRWDARLKQAASKYSIADWRWLKAIMWIESSLGRAKSVKHGLLNPTDIEGSASYDKKSWGLMQVTKTTANDMRPGTTEADLNNPEISIDLGARYFSMMLKRYNENSFSILPARAVRAYNQGPGNEDKRKSYANDYLKKFEGFFQKIREKQ